MFLSTVWNSTMEHKSGMCMRTLFMRDSDWRLCHLFLNLVKQVVSFNQTSCKLIQIINLSAWRNITFRIGLCFDVFFAKLL